MSNTQQQRSHEEGFDPSQFNFKNFMQSNAGFTGAQAFNDIAAGNISFKKSYR